MNAKLIALIITLLPTSSFAQTVNPAKLKFNGVGLDSTYAQVVRAIGKPSSEEKAKDEECAGGREKTVRYPGLELFFMDSGSRDGKTFELMSFEVTTKRWVVSGIKIGDTEAAVRRRFGRKHRTYSDPDTRAKTWYYDMGDRIGPGGTNIVFKEGKVVMISSSYTVC